MIELGKKYGLLTPWQFVSAKSGQSGARLRVICSCECGGTTEVRADAVGIRRGKPIGCGCRRGLTATGNPNLRTHGQTGEKVYHVWKGIKARCHGNPNDRTYKRYGARGITVCDRWRQSFEAFYADVGDPPAGCTLDRIDNDGDYRPENCRWATYAQQSRNSSRAINLTYMGRTMCLTDWAEEAGLSRHTFTARLESGWTLERAIETPLRKRRHPV